MNFWGIGVKHFLRAQDNIFTSIKNNSSEEPITEFDAINFISNILLSISSYKNRIQSKVRQLRVRDGVFVTALILHKFDVMRTIIVIN